MREQTQHTAEIAHQPNRCCDYHRHIADGCCHCEQPPGADAFEAERDALMESVRKAEPSKARDRGEPDPRGPQGFTLCRCCGGRISPREDHCEWCWTGACTNSAGCSGRVRLPNCQTENDYRLADPEVVAADHGHWAAGAFPDSLDDTKTHLVCECGMPWTPGEGCLFLQGVRAQRLAHLGGA